MAKVRLMLVKKSILSPGCTLDFPVISGDFLASVALIFSLLTSATYINDKKWEREALNQRTLIFNRNREVVVLISECCKGLVFIPICDEEEVKKSETQKLLRKTVWGKLVLPKPF